jgi:murein DD-endopeptidase MepM/ murein hydrolase activator NlpD
VHEYKRFENNLVKRVSSFFRKAVVAAAHFFAAFFRVLMRRYTIVLVPHSEKKVYNLQISFLSVCAVALALTAFMGTFAWYGKTYSENSQTLSYKDSRLRDTQASLDQLRDEMAGLMKEARNFQVTLSGVFNSLGVHTEPEQSNPEYSGDLSSFFNTHETAEGRLREADDIRSLSKYLSSSVEPLKEMENLFDSQSTLLTEIPNIWPIKGGIGHISQFFGENPNPFTGLNYVHKGIDLSTYRFGDAVIATADGQVVTVDFDQGGFGNYVIIRHKHGFYTRYGHMQRTSVKTGQRVQQGETIGTIGSTGYSTGPHLHYEVHIGSDIVDPYKFLNIRPANKYGSGGGKGVTR